MRELPWGDWERVAPAKRVGFIAAGRSVQRSKVGNVAFERRTRRSGTLSPYNKLEECGYIIRPHGPRTA